MDKLNQKGSRIAELIEKGREQGYLTYSDVNDHLPDDISDPDQVDEIIGMINDLGLQVHETAPDADTLMLAESENSDDIALEQAAEALAAVENETLEGEIRSPTAHVNKTKDITLGFIKLKNELRSNARPSLEFLDFILIWLNLLYFR